MQQRRVLITGGGGFLGTALARKCVERGDRVYSFSRRSHRALADMGVIQIPGDVVDAKAVDAALKDKDAVFHLAAKTGNWGRLAPFYKINVKGTRNVIAACKKQRVPVLVYTSTTRVMLDGADALPGDERTGYPERFRSNFAMSKAFAEQAVKKAADENLRTIILRPHMIWGPGDTSTVPGFCRDRKPLIRIGDGKNMVSGIYVEDAATAHLNAADKVLERPDISGNAYVIARDEPILLWGLIDTIRVLKGKDPVKMHLSRDTAQRVGMVLEFFHKTLKIPFDPVITTNMVKELSLSHVFDIGPSVTDLGFEPSVSLAEGMKDYEGWLVSNRWRNTEKREG